MKDYSLIGVDGNAFSVIGYVVNAMRKEGNTIEERDLFTKEAMSGDYNNLLTFSMNKVNELNEEREERE